MSRAFSSSHYVVIVVGAPTFTDGRFGRLPPDSPASRGRASSPTLRPPGCPTDAGQLAVKVLADGPSRSVERVG
jgi:hypothetical protein